MDWGIDKRGRCKIMFIELPDARQLPDPVLEALRLRALHGCEQGYAESELADILGLRPETISRWWSAYKSGGLAAIPQDRTGRPVGSGRTSMASKPSIFKQRSTTMSPRILGSARLCGPDVRFVS